jgi:hypothetical protein
VKLRKALEITVDYATTEGRHRALLFDPSDRVAIESWKGYEVSRRIVYRLANHPLHNTTTDGPPF